MWCIVPLAAPFSVSSSAATVQRCAFCHGWSAPPLLRHFLTPVYHPNIAQGTGAVCLDLLKPPPAGTWSPARCGLRVLLLSLQQLLATPNVHDPLEADIAAQLQSNPAAFRQAAQAHCAKHAAQLCSAAAPAAAEAQAAEATAPSVGSGRARGEKRPRERAHDEPLSGGEPASSTARKVAATEGGAQGTAAARGTGSTPLEADKGAHDA